MPAAEREEDEHPADRDRGDDDHDRGCAREEAERDPGVAHVVERERAAICTSSPKRERSRDDLLRQLVGGDGGDDDRGQADPLAQAAPSGRSAARIRRSAFVVDRRGRRGSTDSFRAGSFTGPRSSSSQPPRVVDAEASRTASPRAARPGSPCRRPRRCRTRPTRSSRARSRSGAAARGRPLRALVELALVGLRPRSVSQVIVGGGDGLAGFLLDPGDGAVVVVLDRPLQPLPRLLELLTEVGVSMLIRLRSPVRPPWRAVARSRPA